MLSVGKWLVSAFLAVMALILTVGVVLLSLFFFNKEWQASALDAFLESTTDWRWELASADLGWNRVAATGVFALRNADGFEMRSVDLDVRTVSLLRRDPVLIKGGTLEGCMLDLSGFPAEVLGFSASELAGLPSTAHAHGAVERMVRLGLERLQMSNLDLEVNDLRIEGVVLLPANRSVAFDLRVESATTMRPEDARLTVTQALFR